MHLAAKRPYLIVQVAWLPAQHAEFHLEATSIQMTHDVERAHLGPTPVHASKNMKNTDRRVHLRLVLEIKLEFSL